MHLYEHQFKAMGTLCQLRLFAASAEQAQQTIAAVVADVERLEAKYSRYRPSSLLSQINEHAAQGSSLSVDDETAYLLDYAHTCYQQSAGLFDISSGLLRQAWDFKQQRIPSQPQLATLLPRVGWHHIHWQRPQLQFNMAGMELDFGGIVKEYAADRAATLCQQHGQHHALINLGGDIRVTGPQADGTPWHIGLSNPANPEQALCTLALQQGALASSGDYQRCIDINGVRYSHILNPKTGWPTQGLAAVSVLADHCVVAGSVSTIAMLKGEAGKAWLQELGLPHWWVDGRGECGGSLVKENIKQA